MSQVIKFVKVVSSLPETLEKNTVYFVKTGPDVRSYVTNDLGLVVAYPLTVDLTSKADVSHTHSISDVTGLTTELNNKQKTITQSATAPVSPEVGDLWIDLS